MIGDEQFFRGYTVFLCKQHAFELHELEADFKVQFLTEMSLVAEAVFKAFQPHKLNHELAGNIEKHMHWHLFPRHASEPEPYRARWVSQQAAGSNLQVIPAPDERDTLRYTLLQALEQTAPDALVCRFH